MPDVQAPTTAELLNNPVVQGALEDAWLDSRTDNSAERHEEGDWIYLEIASGNLMIRRAPRGKRSSIDLNSPPLVPGAMVVGKFHTHPNPTAEGWEGGPSSADRRTAARHGVPSLIRADDGIHTAGPDSRRGRLSSLIIVLAESAGLQCKLRHQECCERLNDDSWRRVA
jgi:hypothetical protein